MQVEGRTLPDSGEAFQHNVNVPVGSGTVRRTTPRLIICFGLSSLAKCALDSPTAPWTSPFRLKRPLFVARNPATIPQVLLARNMSCGADQVAGEDPGILPDQAEGCASTELQKGMLLPFWCQIIIDAVT